MEYNEEVEVRMTILEARLAFTEQRLANLERSGWPTAEAKPKKARRELTDEEKKVIRERLVAGQERKRLEREAEAKTQAKTAKKKEAL